MSAQTELEQARRLLAHRELQMLRAAGVRSRGGRSWVRARGKKLAETQALVARLEARAAAEAASVCVSAHHRTPVPASPGTDRCDECWSDAAIEQASQR